MGLMLHHYNRKKLDIVYLQSTAHNESYYRLSVSASSYSAFSPDRVTIKGNAYEENIMLLSKRKKSQYFSTKSNAWP
jgi:hypothetical protein